MKRISYAVMSTLTALVLLFGYRTSTSSHAASSGTITIGNTAASSSTSTSASSSQTTSSAGSPPTGTRSSSSPTSSSASPSPSASSAAAAKTVTGAAVDTRYGPVQVRLTVQNGKIANVSVIQYPNGDGRDQEINANALPILIDETLKAQTAHIDTVSGATYTSEGYLTSLQSALDQAG